MKPRKNHVAHSCTHRWEEQVRCNPMFLGKYDAPACCPVSFAGLFFIVIFALS
nr:MAG TPA: hypothetical protein [Caudoviricetes sp.]